MADVLATAIRARFVYIRIARAGREVSQVVSTESWQLAAQDPGPIAKEIEALIDAENLSSVLTVPKLGNEGPFQLATSRISTIGGGQGFIVAASAREEFPRETDKLLLSAGASQAAILIQRSNFETEIAARAEELAQTLAQVRATLESTPDAILVTDNDGAVTDFNVRFVETWRLDPQVVETRNHKRWLDEISPQLVDPEEYRRTVDEITTLQPADSFHVLLTADERVFERHTKIQRVGERVVGRVWSLRDVTQHRRAEAALRRNEKLLSDFFDNATVALHWVGPDGKILRANRAELKMLGYSEPDFVGHHISEFHADKAAIDHILKTLVRGGELREYEARLRCQDGTVKDVLISSNVLWEDGKFVHTRCFTRDITEQKQAEAIRARLAAVVESSDDAIVSKSLDSIIRTWNRGAAQMFGYTAEEIVGTSVLRLIPPERASEENEILKRLNQGERIEHYETVRQRKDGSRFDVSLTVSPIFDAKGQVIGASKIARDITKAKQAEKALREESAINEQINAVSNALATELDLDKIVQIITDAATQATGAHFGALFYNHVDEQGGSYVLYALAGVPRKAFEGFPMPRATEMFGPTFRGEGIIRLDDVRQDPRFGKNSPHHGMPAGHLPVVSYLAVPVIARTGEVLGGLFFGHPQPGMFKERDEKTVLGLASQASAAMEKARLYHAEQKARLAAETANRTKDDFLAALSHELRTPLTPVLAILSNIAEEAALPPAVSADLETVRRNVELETRLIDDLLDLTRITRGKLELHWGPIQVGQLIENALGICFPEIKAKALNLVRDIAASDVTFSGDSARLTQVLWNLLKNAIKFTPPTGTVTVRARVTPGDGNENLTISVEDTGIGMEPDQLLRVFDAFEQGDRKITQQFGGLGLGLAISKAIAESHGGMITAASKGVGRGSLFTLTLPRKIANDSANAVPPPTIRNTPSSPGPHPIAAGSYRPRILLVEDHGDTSAILVRLLTREGYEIIHRASVASALETAEKEMHTSGLDLIVSDLGLPDGSGLELMRKLSAKYGLRGVALSGFGMESDREQSAAAGFARHLTKPVDVAALRQTIRELVKSR